MNRRNFLEAGIAFGALSSFTTPLANATTAAETDDRKYWLEIATKIAAPVLISLSEEKLKLRMPVEAPHGNFDDRKQFTYLEAFGRLLSGLAPWLESGAKEGPEAATRTRYAELARAAMHAATNPASPDFLNFDQGAQPVVDTAFLALAILRAPTELWAKLDAATKANLIKALESSRVIRPGYNNWLLFSATIEAALAQMGAWWDPMHIDYAIRSLDSWYKGDGLYGDGPEFHFDYYNSYVMHPMLLAVLDAISQHDKSWDSFKPRMLERARRYAVIQERLIAPDATFPAIGRSLCYRFGAFHLLADVSLRQELPESLAPSAVRSALTAVMRKMLQPAEVFDKNGWLTVGFYGHQPSIAEPYISTGSCYLCSAAWLPLGLSDADPFWSAPAQPWTSQKIWSGAPMSADHAI